MNNIDFTSLAKWLMYGAVVFLGWSLLQVATGFIEAWQADMREEEACIAEIRGPGHFREIDTPDTIARYISARYDAIVLNTYALGTDGGTKYFYVHTRRTLTPSFTDVMTGRNRCSGMLIKHDTSGVWHTMEPGTNRVAIALLEECNKQAHTMESISSLLTFVINSVCTEAEQRQDNNDVTIEEQESV